MKVCLFGGTFDPPHIGHLLIAQTVCEAENFDKILFIPAFWEEVMKVSESEIEISKSDLLKIKNGDKYVEKIDAVVEKYKNNENALRAISIKISYAKSALTSRKNKSERVYAYIAILQYFDLKNQVALNEILAKKK